MSLQNGPNHKKFKRQEENEKVYNLAQQPFYNKKMLKN